MFLHLLRRSLARGSRSTPAGVRRLRLEALEDRTLPSSIVWTNRGNATQDPDDFNKVFGTNAATARTIVDAALDAWERVISNFNFSNGSNTFEVDISMSNNNDNGGASSTGLAYDANGKPKKGQINLGRGTNGHGAGYYLDPNPTDWAEFSDPVTGFTGTPPSGSPVSGFDLFSVVVHELAHVLGINRSILSAFRNDPNGYIDDTGQPDIHNPGAGTLFTFTGPSVQALLTSNNGGPNGTGLNHPVHTAQIFNTYTNSTTGTTYDGCNDVLNPVLFPRLRHLPSLLAALILKDAYGYTITVPQTFGSFYVNLNEATGQLVVRGADRTQGPTTITSNDIVTIRQDNGILIVSVDVGADVPGTGPTGPLESRFFPFEVNSIVIQTGGGNDTIRIEGNKPGGVSIPITIDAGDGDDIIVLSPQVRDLDDLASGNTITSNGGPGNDSLFVNDGTDSVAGRAYTITDATVTRGAHTFPYSSIQTLVVNAGTGANPIQVRSSPLNTAVIVTGGGGNDTITVGSTGNTLDAVRGNLTVFGDSGTDTLTINDQGTTIARTYTLTSLSVSRSGAGTIFYDILEGVTLNCGSGSDTVAVQSTTSVAPVTINAGSGTDTITVSNTSNTLNGILGALTVNGQGGTDALNLADQGTSTAKSYTLTATTVKRSDLALVTFGTVETLGLTAGSGGDTLTVSGGYPAGTTTTFNGGPGTDTLVGVDTVNTWRITASNAGDVNGKVHFQAVENLTGGTSLDRFVFSNGQGVAGVLDGRGGTDTLDYAAYTSGVTVNLATGAATGASGGANSIENVTGGLAGDSLTGNAGSNVLRGGDGADSVQGLDGADLLLGEADNDRLDGGGGRNVLIGGRGSDLLQGGPDDDLLIGGTTAFDADDPTLLAILEEWKRTDRAYLERVKNLRQGGGLNGSAVLDATTVFEDGDKDELAGGAGLDWFFIHAGDSITDLAAGEEVG
jgi:Ca2+-binding RTX toxin-like protein